MGKASERCIPVSAVPPSLEPEELRLKLTHLRAVLEQAARPGIFLVQEGALRWLTGMRHQVIEVAPDAPSPVCALIMARGSALELTFVSSFTELPRLKARLPEALAAGSELRLEFQERLPALPEGCLAPSQADYAAVVGRLVRPLLGGLKGGPFRKLEWLHGQTHAALAAAAQALEPGLDGQEVQALLRRELDRRRIESNLILVAVKGQEEHLHPLYDRGCRVERGSEVKLVAGARFAELIVSASVMVRIGAPPQMERRDRAYRALQQGALEYADCYRPGAVEGDIYREIGRRFALLETQLALPGFARSAYAHHLGGPTSPLGNRDYLIVQGGTRTMFPWMQFAVNPVEVLHHAKVELQGVVMPEGAPLILDASTQLRRSGLTFSRLTASGGTTGMVPDVIRRD
jgi:Xaa-Pro aminopeptidase